MSWPTPQEYNEAVQNPRLCFADPELQAGTAEVTALGLPRPITGNFASVYRVRCPGQDWAVRCFWREYADLQERYHAISRHLQTAQLPYTVPFQYLPQGIRVRGGWYPALRMQWVEGALLHEYVAARLQDPSSLRHLSRQWLAMSRALERGNIAHGDLQHGNVIVLDDALKLVDYDGMYVPALAGRASHELGHPNYQHPARTGTDFGPATDRFSTWVVYLSLLAVGREPNLWSELNGGDECLLLRRQDFLDPASPLLTRLTEHPDPALRETALRFRGCLTYPPALVPRLAAVDSDGGRDSRRFWSVGVWRQRRAGNEEWETETLLPEWLREEVTASAAPLCTFSISLLLPRLFLAAGMVALVVSCLVGIVTRVQPVVLGAVLLAVSVLTLATVFLCYARDPVVAGRRALLRREGQQRRALAAINREVSRLQRKRDRLAAQAEIARAKAGERTAAGAARWQRQEAEVGAVFRETLDDLDHQRVELDRRERETLTEILHCWQVAHLTACLHRAKVRTAQLPDLDWRLKIYLWVSGVRRAADIDPEHAAVLKGIARPPAMALIAWRRSVQEAATHSMPSRLPEEITGPITARCAGQRQWLASSRRAVETTEAAVLGGLAARYAHQSLVVERKSARIISDLEQQRLQIETRMAEVRQDEPFHHRQREQTRRELRRYRQITVARYVAALLFSLSVPWNATSHKRRGDSASHPQ